MQATGYLNRAGKKSSSVSLRDVISAIFRQSKIIGLVFFIILVGVTAIVLLIPNRYETRMKVLVKNARAEVIVSPEQTTNLQQSNEITEAQVNSEIELIRSRDLLTAVVKKTGLAKQLAKQGNADSPEIIERAVIRLEKDLQVSAIKKANIIEIKYQAASPAVAAEVLQTLSEAYLDRHLQVHRVPGTGEFFKAQAATYEGELKQAEGALVAFENRNNIVSLPSQKEMGLKQVADAESETWRTEASGNETASRIQQTRQQLNHLDSRISTQRKTVPHQYSVERLNTMLVELRHKRTQLLERFQPQDRLVKEVEQQIADTEAAVTKANQQQSVEQTTDVNPLRQSLELDLARAEADLTARRARQQDLTRQLNDAKAKLNALEGTTLKHAEMERRVKELQLNYELFAKKRDEALIADALDKQKISNVSIAETATVPSLPASPNRSLYLALGLFLAGFVGIGAGAAAELTRDSVHTPRELEAFSDYPVLATVPWRKDLPGKQSAALLPSGDSGKSE